MDDIKDSVLDSTKKILGLTKEYDVFDLDIITHINTVLMTLEQLGVGPIGGYFITDSSSKWTDFLGEDPRLNSVKSYVYMRVRLMFDPPSTSFAITSIEKQIQEMEWRLTLVVDPPYRVGDFLERTPNGS